MIKKLALLALIILLSPVLSKAADEVPPPIKLDFENFSLEALPSGWKKDNAANLALIQDPKHGMVLKVVNKSGQTSGLSFTLKPEQYAGKILDVKADVKLLAEYKPGEKFFQLPKIQGKWRNAEGKYKYFTLKIENGTNDWKTITGRMVVPEKATNITVGMVIEDAGAEVLYDNFALEMVPPSKPFKAEPVAPSPPPPAAPTKPTEPEKPAVKLEVPGLGEKKPAEGAAAEKKEPTKPKTVMRTEETE